MRLPTLIIVFLLVLLATFALGFVLGAQAKAVLRQQAAEAEASPTAADTSATLTEADADRQRQIVQLANARNPFVRPASSLQGRFQRLGLVEELTVGAVVSNPTGALRGAALRAATRPRPINAAAAKPASPGAAPGGAPPTADGTVADTAAPPVAAPQPATPAAATPAAATPATATPPTQPANVAVTAGDSKPAARFELSRLALLADPPAGTMAAVLRPPPSAQALDTAAAPIDRPVGAVGAAQQAVDQPVAAYSVEVAQTDDSMWASALVSRLLEAGDPAYLRVAGTLDGRDVTHVRVGVFPDREAALTAARDLTARHGLNATVLRVAGVVPTKPAAEAKP
jgi:hypothetical protein